MYINGVSVGLTVLLGSNSGDWFADSSTTARDNVSAGAIVDSDGVTIDYTGDIDDVRVYNYPMTSAQIKAAMNEGAALRYGP